MASAVFENQGIKNQVWIGNSFAGNGGTGYTIAQNHTPSLWKNSWDGV